MLQEGDELPPFELPDQDGRLRRLGDLTGPRGLILYVYPKDDTPGCTTEALDFQRLAGELAGKGYRVVGVSRDDAPSHCRFRAQHGLGFPLLTDATAEYLTAIGAFGEKSSYGRTSIGIRRSTLVVGPEGRIQKALYNVKATGHAERVLREL